MMIHIKRLCALMLALSMALTLCGCGEKEDPTPDVPVGPGTSQKDPAPAPQPAPAPVPDPAPADPEPNKPADPDTPQLPTPTVSSGDLNPTASSGDLNPDAAPLLREDVLLHIDGLLNQIVGCCEYFALYSGYDAARQTAEAGLLTDTVNMMLAMLDEWVLVPTIGLSKDETNYFTQLDRLVAEYTAQWAELLYAPQPEPLPAEMEAILLQIEQMYRDSYTYMVAQTDPVYAAMTDYPSYKQHHEALVAAMDKVIQRCIEDCDPLRQLATRYYKLALELEPALRDRAMAAFYDRALAARIACVDTYYAIDLGQRYYESCYIHFVTDAWQGSLSWDAWSQPKIDAQEEFYFFGSVLLGCEDVREFHQIILDAFARGDYDVDYLMIVKD